jgi:protein-L-isoaspartate(D-aspartate) O-methyltransferase
MAGSPPVNQWFVPLSCASVSMQNAKSYQEDPAWTAAVSAWVLEAGILNEDVERVVSAAFAAVPRSSFLESSSHGVVYQDVDVPVAAGVVLTRPSVLIRMLGLINLRRRMRILELGVGSGYLCAVMAAAGASVFGVDSNTQSVQAARKQLDGLGYHGVVVRRGDGKKGWSEVAPFDAIVVSYPVFDEADLPLSQLADQGCLVAPLRAGECLRLTLWKRTGDVTRRIVFEEVTFQ